jgi:hypothetical protein
LAVVALEVREDSAYKVLLELVLFFQPLLLLAAVRVELVTQIPPDSMVAVVAVQAALLVRLLVALEILRLQRHHKVIMELIKLALLVF